METEEVDTDKEEKLAIVHKACECVEPVNGDRVLDIHCGDGTLLGWYTKRLITVGVEEDAELMKTALNAKKVDVGVPGKFSASAVKDMCAKFNAEPKFRVITAIDTLSEPVLPFLSDCKELLCGEGVLVIQSPHRLTSSVGFMVTELNKCVEEINLQVQGIELPKKGVFRAYISHPSFKKFCVSDSEMKLRMYFVYSTTMIRELRQPVTATDFNLRPNRQETRNAI